ncbi:MAG: YicC family protein [Planctomycetota bacterium]|jgi:uncharacterized protein (TIGR00255 family)|nr:YicC family protein [Planctomycetota bacterium]
MADILSMTGFGASQVEADGYLVKMEVKSVNNRGLKIAVRARPSLGPCEKKLRDYLSAELRRGAVDAYVSVERPAAAAARPIRAEAARSAVESLRRLAAELDLADNLAAGDLAGIPGVFDLSAEEPLSPEEWRPVETALRDATGQVKAMRLAEGRALAEVLLGQAAPLEAFVAETNRLAPRALERARERLEKRLAEICPNGFSAADNQALEREMCLIADRADIREELDRLASHIAQYRQAIREGGEVGKRLEFIAQEFLREINTTASKTNDTGIVQGAVRAKLAVEVIKEQSANIV